MADAGLRVRVRVENADEIVRALQAQGERAEEALREAARAGAEVIREAAVARAPGPHIVAEVTQVSAQRVEFEIGPDDEHWHYRFFETGTRPHGPRKARIMRWFGSGGEPIWARRVRGIPARPFLRPAIDEHRDEATAVIGQVLRRKLGI